MNRSPTAATVGMMESLSEEIQDFAREVKTAHLRYRLANLLLITGSILVGGGVTVASIFKQSIVAAILGVFVSVFVALHSALSVSAKSDFYQLIAAEARNLLTDLKYTHVTEKKRAGLLEELKTLRTRAIKELPRSEQLERGLSTIAGGMTPHEEMSDEDELQVKRIQVREKLEFLNRLSSLTPRELGDDHRRQMEAGIRGIKLMLMSTVWGSDWGSLEEFVYWADNEGQEPVTEGLSEAARYYRSVQEGVP
jgi:hypothetical protein